MGCWCKTCCALLIGLLMGCGSVKVVELDTVVCPRPKAEEVEEEDDGDGLGLCDDVALITQFEACMRIKYKTKA